MAEEPFPSNRNGLKQISIPKIKSGINKNAALSGHRTQQNSNGLLVSNQHGVQKKTFEYLTNNIQDNVHAHTLDEQSINQVELSQKLLRNKKEKDDILSDYFSAKKKFGR